MMFNSAAPPSENPSPVLTMLRLQNEFSELLQSGDQADVTFLVQGEEIPGHKLILTTRCGYFRAAFNSGMSEEVSKRVEVPDIRPAVFKQLLEFIYTNVSPTYDQDVTLELLAAADKYGVNDLKKICESLLCHNLGELNVIDALIIADKYDCSALIKRATMVFGIHVKVLKTRNCWQKLKENSSLLLKLLEHFCD